MEAHYYTNRVKGSRTIQGDALIEESSLSSFHLGAAPTWLAASLRSGRCSSLMISLARI